MSAILSSCLLYAPGAFFFYPWKPVAQYLLGDRYDTGLRFFCRDHSDPTSLALHLVALVLQLAGNFGLLATVDATLWPDRLSLGGYPLPERPLSYVTAVAWVGTLLVSPAPLETSLLSAGFVAAAFVSAPHLSPHFLELGVMAIFIATLLLASLVFERKVHAGRRFAGALGDAAYSCAYLAGYVAAPRLAARQWRGAWASEALPVNLFLLLLALAAAALPKPVKPVAVAGLLAARTAGELTAQDALVFYGCAFVGMLMQKLAHDVSRQEATLLAHERDEHQNGRAKQLSFEWAHAVYFPNLLVHAVRSAMRGVDPCAKEA